MTPLLCSCHPLEIQQALHLLCVISYLHSFIGAISGTALIELVSDFLCLLMTLQVYMMFTKDWKWVRITRRHNMLCNFSGVISALSLISLVLTSHAHLQLRCIDSTQYLPIPCTHFGQEYSTLNKKVTVYGHRYRYRYGYGYRCKRKYVQVSIRIQLWAQ